MKATAAVKAKKPAATQPAYPPITINPERMSGTPTFAGSRLPVTTLIDYLSEGYDIHEFRECFPGRTEAEIQAVLALIKGN